MIRLLYRHRLFRTVLVVTMSLLLPAQDLLARGGGGRGGGGGGFRGGGGGGGFRGGGGGGGYRGGGGGGYRGGGGGGRPMNPGASHSVARPGGGGGGMNRPGGGGGMGGNRPPVGGGGGRGGIGGGNIAGGGRGGIGGGNIGGGGRGGTGIGGGGRGGIGGGGRGGEGIGGGGRGGIGGGGRGGQGIGGGGRGGEGIGGRGGNNIAGRGGNNINARGGNNFNNNHFNNGAWGNHYGNYHNYNNYWHHGYWHGGWGYGGWGWGYGWGGLAAAGLLGWGLGSMYAMSGYGGGYSNPYYGETVASAPYLDYSQPIQATAAPQTDSTDGASAPSPEIAAALVPFDAARDAFKAGKYDLALTKVEEALQKLPNDAALHEFRGLVLFALAKYKDAASTIYAVLSAGPGWDWTTLSGMYPSVDVYTQQLRALEAFSRQNPESPDAAFVLAYHYLTCGYKEAAAKELQTVVRLLPNDQLAPRLLKMVSGDAAPAGTPPGPTITPQPPEAAQEAAPQEPDAGPPVDKAKVIGTWKASSGMAVSIELTLKEDGTFVWKVAQAGRSNAIEGTYTLDGSTLVLKQKSDGDSMNGKVTLNEKGGFNFKLLETGPGDPGLNFSR